GEAPYETKPTAAAGTPPTSSPTSHVRTRLPERQAAKGEQRAAAVSSVRRPCKRRDMTEHGRDVAVAVENDRPDDEEQRESGGSDLRTGAQAAGEREDRADDEHPAEQVV